jgi:hypothetical protein
MTFAHNAIHYRITKEPARSHAVSTKMAKIEAMPRRLEQNYDRQRAAVSSIPVNQDAPT